MKIPEYKLLFYPGDFVEGYYFDTGYDIHGMCLERSGRHEELRITIMERPTKETAEYADDMVYRPPHPIPYLRIGSYLRIVNVEKEGDEYDSFEGLYAIFDISNNDISVLLVLRKVDLIDEENPIFASRCQTGVSKGSKVRVEAVDDGQDELLDGDWVYKEPTWFLSCGHEAKGKERPNFCPVCGKEVDGE